MIKSLDVTIEKDRIVISVPKLPLKNEYQFILKLNSKTCIGGMPVFINHEDKIIPLWDRFGNTFRSERLVYEYEYFLGYGNDVEHFINFNTPAYKTSAVIKTAVLNLICGGQNV